MKKKTGILMSIAGLISSLLGFLGLSCALGSPVCGGICLTGLLTAVMGVGVAGFIFKNSALFIITGCILITVSLIMILGRRNKKMTECSCQSKDRIGGISNEEC